MERRLAAILATDVVGYSRLIRADEEGTLAALQALRADLIDPKIAEHHGRIVKLMGDGMLAEFPSVVDAVRAAIETQLALAKHNSGLPKDKRIEFRAGINLGDVVIDGDDIQGDGVNIAARLEGLAQPGGICISGSVHEQIRDRIDQPFEDMGEQQVKNIERPVRVWRCLADAETVSDDASVVAGPTLSTQKPSIAVLPFTNMSGDAEQEYFADGMAEDIITGLSRFGWLRVIARNSTFSFKGQSIDVKQVAEALGVRYVLEGSIRKGGNRIRVTAQLIAVEADNHIWAERYDREVSDIFAVQDEVTDAIISAIAPEIDLSEGERSRRKPPHALDAWDLYQRGMADYHRRDPSNLESAIETFDRAAQKDPEFAPAWAMAALARTSYVLNGRPEGRDAMLRTASEKAQMALHLDPRDPLCICADGTVLDYLGEHELGIARLREAIALNPNDTEAYVSLAHATDAAGRHEETIVAADQAIQLSPRDVAVGQFFVIRAFALFHLGRYEEAAASAHESMHSLHAHAWAFVGYAISLFRLGREDDAIPVLADVYSRIPEFSLSYAREALRHHNPGNVHDTVNTLRELGVPE